MVAPMVRRPRRPGRRVTARHGELEGHLFSNVDEFGAATLNALRQTIALARAGRLTYCITPVEAEAPLTARGAELVPAGDLCLEAHYVADLDMRLICLLSDDHDGTGVG